MVRTLKKKKTNDENVQSSIIRHDMAGCITTPDGVHHAFQGCPASGGWAHSTSKDLVHWTFEDLNVHQIHEIYEGMDSQSSPCSGFVTIDEENGTPCAGTFYFSYIYIYI